MGKRERRPGPILTSLLLVVAFVSTTDTRAQVREALLHTRGLLHETVFNNGIIGQPFRSHGLDETSRPLTEWPAPSATIVSGIEYSGQHNSVGGGVWIAANEEGKPGYQNRLISFSGAIGARDPEISIGRWSFPIAFRKIENFPLTPDGELNPDYDPDDAEEIIIAEWATNTGITVKRTSRAWSYPDYDDFIIYEYVFTNTGNRDGDPATIEHEGRLLDVIIAVQHQFAPSMYGFQRHYQQWKFADGVFQGDTYGWFDPDYWLQFNMDKWTGIGNSELAGKPEPNADLFLEFARTGENFGGLGSPQAAGIAALYYDRDHLAYVDSLDYDGDESEYEPNAFELFDWKGKARIKQPFHMWQNSGRNHGEKILSDETRGGLGMASRKSGIFNQNDNIYGYEPNFTIERWGGRAQAVVPNRADKGPAKNFGFGPYTLEPGEEIRFAFVVAVGFGAEPGKVIMGGSEESWLNPIPSWNKKIIIDDEVVTEHYLEDFGYPLYINSDVRNLTHSVHKAYEAYTGEERPYDPSTGKPADGEPWWPAGNPEAGVYAIPVPPPSPIPRPVNTKTGEVEVQWSTAVDRFTHPRLTGEPVEYQVWRSYDELGPWALLGTVAVGDVSPDGEYVFEDADPAFRTGETAFYAVTAADENGNRGARTHNQVRHTKQVGAVEQLGEVQVVPNPFRVESGFSTSGSQNRIGFYGLPEKCTIEIYSFAGQLVDTIEHNFGYSEPWDMVTRNRDALASGVYIFVVTTPEGDTAHGKFLVIK